MKYSEEKISSGKLAAYASPAIPIAAMGVPIAVYLPPFYAQDMGLGLSVVGIIFMIARMWDVFTDPLLGVISDRYPSKWGRRRHWIVLSVPIMLVATVMLFMPQKELVSSTYLLGWMFVLYIAWTLLSLSHQAWGAELSPCYHQRTRIQGVREIALLIGAVVVLSLPSLIEQLSTENIGTKRIAAMGWMVVILLPLTVAWAVSSVGESIVTTIQPISWQDTMTAVTGNKPLQRLLTSQFMSGISQGITAALLLFLTADVLDLGKWSSIILLLHFISGVFYIPLFVKISEKIGKHRALSCCAIIYAIGMNVVWFVPEGAVVFMSIIMFALGMALGVLPFLNRSILADVVDEDSVNNDMHRAGLFYSLYNMVEKVGGAVAIGVVYMCLDVIDFKPGEENTESAITGLKMLFIIPPMLLNLLIARLMFKFPIDRDRQEKNREILDKRAAGNHEAESMAEKSLIN